LLKVFFVASQALSSKFLKRADLQMLGEVLQQCASANFWAPLNCVYDFH